MATLTLNELETAIVNQLNVIRTNPSGYADMMERETQEAYFDDAGETGKMRFKFPGTNMVLMTHEGVRGCMETISFLRSVRPLPALQLSYGMCLAAKEAANRTGASGSTGAPASLELFPRYGKAQGESVEIAVFGNVNERGIVNSIILCDGDQARRHRNMIFNPDYKLIGVGAGPHNSSHNIMACINLAAQFFDK
eukprot:TRINITY_DN2618_c0_g2_i1.p1 TRINITY_DN2618_c0_g2~~TRINITY_DN2618_c0_g2_i1.p1  ORF type:complete len:195 (-),score=45.48 TRINITY_DN2618_c0_g2_i1:39-623(-)